LYEEGEKRKKRSTAAGREVRRNHNVGKQVKSGQGSGEGVKARASGMTRNGVEVFFLLTIGEPWEKKIPRREKTSPSMGRGPADGPELVRESSPEPRQQTEGKKQIFTRRNVLESPLLWRSREFTAVRKLISKHQTVPL